MLATPQLKNRHECRQPRRWVTFRKAVVAVCRNLFSNILNRGDSPAAGPLPNAPAPPSKEMRKAETDSYPENVG
jgi:hypothetical protein